MKKVLDIAIDRLKTDEIFFDNVFLQAEPKSCRCPRCMKAFTEFLARKYPSGETATLRFGFPDASFVKVNKWYYFNRPESLQTIDDPVLQEWTGFRTESVARACADFHDYIKAKNPKIAVGFNLKGIYGTNRIWRNAVYHPLFRDKIDFSCFDVGGMEARLDPKTGAMVSGSAPTSSRVRSDSLIRKVAPPWTSPCIWLLTPRNSSPASAMREARTPRAPSVCSRLRPSFSASTTSDITLARLRSQMSLYCARGLRWRTAL